MQRIEIMRPGRFTAMAGQAVDFTEDSLRLAAVAYDAAKAPAPIVIGHPAINAPAYGWVKGLDFADGTLGAYVGDLAPSFADDVKAKRYAKVSASFFAPDSTANPRPGIFYLRHVGFLGATAPAVPGLKPVSFAEDAAALDFAHEADAFANRDAADTANGRALARIAELEGRERSRTAQDMAAFCDDLVRQARLPMGLRDLAFAALSQAPDDAIVSFGEGEAARSIGQREALKELLGKLPPMIAFGEVAGVRGPLAGGDDLVLPEGFTADPERAAFAQRAEAIATARSISFAEAVKLAERGAA